MLALDKETFSYWVTYPDDLTATDFVQLQESLLAYPYCQSLHTLTAKAASVYQRSQAIGHVRQAAAYALSRNALRKLIDNEFQWSDNLLTKLNELSAKHVPVPEDYQHESYALFKSKAEMESGFPTLPLLQIAAQFEPEPVETVPTPEDTTLSEKALQNELSQRTEAVPDQPEPSPSDLERQRQFDLIDSFIRNEPRISPIRTKPTANQQQEDLTKRSKPVGTGLVTESLAKILVKQGKVDKALEMYSKLMVKNPEKKAYFAEKMGELKTNQKTTED